MQEINGRSSPSPSPNPTQKAETPPHGKKSKTTSSKSDTQPPPLFPAVRRLSPTTSFNSSSAAAVSATSSSNSNSYCSYAAAADSKSAEFGSNFFDRDYVFPSNLGPYSTRRNVSVSSQKVIGKSTKLRAEKDLKALSVSASGSGLIRASEARTEPRGSGDSAAAANSCVGSGVTKKDVTWLRRVWRRFNLLLQIEDSADMMISR